MKCVNMRKILVTLGLVLALSLIVGGPFNVALLAQDPFATATPTPTEEKPEAPAVPAPAEETPEVAVTPEPTEETPEATATLEPTEEKPEPPAVPAPVEETPEAAVTPEPTEETPEATATLEPTEETPKPTVAVKGSPEPPSGDVPTELQAVSPPPEKNDLPRSPAGAQGDKPGLPNLSPVLNQLYAGGAAQDIETQGLEIDGDRVMAMLIMLDEASADSAVSAIPTLGGEVTARYKVWIDAWVPIAALDRVATLPGVSLVREPILVRSIDEPDPSEVSALVGSALTQGVAVSNANAWHAKGFIGSGVKVAVIDSFKDYTTARAMGDLPASISTYGTLDLSSRHGTACAEIIYDMAPGVSLTFASPGTATQMASYITALAAAGNKIISSSMGFYNAEPGDGTGVVADAVTTAYNTYGTLYVQAAGNQANYNWQGTFRDTDGDGWHEFAPGVEINQLGYLPAGRVLLLYLRWSNWPTSNQDYDFFLYYWTGSTWSVAASSTGFQTGTQPPTEEIEGVVVTSGYYGMAIKNWSASGTHVMDLMGHNAPGFQYNMRNRSLVDPATPLRAFSVAAINVAWPYSQESYSSEGPTLNSGGWLSGGTVYAKPRIAAFANVNTWAYGPGVFNGTSSATPHVSGAAALVWGAFPGYTPGQVMTFLESRAKDQGAAGYDFKYGQGRLHLGAPPPPVAFDFNKDRRSNMAVFRPSNGTWYIRGVGNYTYGWSGDIPVAGDYNGDGKTDIAVFRPSNGKWYIRGVGNYTYGWNGDIPVPGDYNGDGKTDIAVFRPSNGKWYIGGVGVYTYGWSGDIPVAGDYNGDGKTDIAVFRPSNGKWYLRGIGNYVYGQSGDIPAPGDYNGDGKTNIAVFRPSNGTWYLRGIGNYGYGESGDIPVPGDYNGDGKTDIAVFWPSGGIWYIRDVDSYLYGQNGDIPAEKRPAYPGYPY